MMAHTRNVASSGKNVKIRNTRKQHTRSHKLTYKQREREHVAKFRREEVHAALRDVGPANMPITRIELCRRIGISQPASYCGPWPEIVRTLRKAGCIAKGNQRAG